MCGVAIAVDEKAGRPPVRHTVTQLRRRQIDDICQGGRGLRRREAISILSEVDELVQPSDAERERFATALYAAISDDDETGEL